jgi:hypothetical protein
VIIVCACNERLEEDEVGAHREAGCPALERSIRKLTAKRRRPWQSEAACGGVDVGRLAPHLGSRSPPVGSWEEVDGVRFKRLSCQERLSPRGALGLSVRQRELGALSGVSVARIGEGLNPLTMR